jgi:DUF4097 and DUF4098 domain-containing protein YvlB
MRLSIAAALALATLAATPALADTTIREARDLAPGGRFVLDAASGSVTLVGASASGASIVIHSTRDDLRDLYDFRFEQSPGEVRVTIKRKDPSKRFTRGESMRIEVEVPRRTAVEIRTSGGKLAVFDVEGNARLDTSGGPVEVARLAGTLRAETSGGPIRLTEIAGDTVARTSGGSIEVTDVRGSLDARSSGGNLRLRGVEGDLRASTSGGSIHIEGARGKVSAETSGGGIEARLAAGNAHGGSLETSGGGVRVYVDPSIDLTFDASTSGGSVTTAFPVTGRVGSDRSSLEGAIGKGGETLTIRSSGGSIRLEAI